MADQALHQFELDEVLWIPAGQPPHKEVALGVSATDRLEMVKLAIAGHSRFRWSDLEIQRQGYSYTVETMEHLVETVPETQWFWIIGADALQDLPSWYQVEQLIELCDWIVAPRVGNVTPTELVANVQRQLPIQAEILDAPYIEISSTFLRDRVKHKGSIRYLVPPAVEEYIQIHGLYSS